jgi:DNA-binding response OmpR family regulator
MNLQRNHWNSRLQVGASAYTLDKPERPCVSRIRLFFSKMTATNKLRILIIEDDPRMLELLCKGLREEGHTTVPAPDGDTGLDLALRHDFDAILLDLGLPGRDGIDIALTLRAENKRAFILMVTARDAEDDVIRGLDSGADHYLVKPFSFAEMLARLKGLTRATPRSAPSSSLALDPVRLTVRRGNKVINLTRSEYLLFSALHRRTGETVIRQTLIEFIWGSDPISPNALDVLVNSLRTKFDAPYEHKSILTVRGVGYSLQPDPALSTDDIPNSLQELIR